MEAFDNLTRNERERCVMARVMRTGRRYQKNFSLGEYGSWEGAESAGAKWVKATVAALPPIKTNEGLLTLRNTSGEVGVTLGRVEFRKKGKKHHKYYRWVAHWPGCPLSGGVAWSWQRFGDDNAYVLAVLSRRMRTVDREVVVARLAEIAGNVEYRAILAQWSR